VQQFDFPFIMAKKAKATILKVPIGQLPSSRPCVKTEPQGEVNTYGEHLKKKRPNLLKADFQ
jgi:hypothetical protein